MNSDPFPLSAACELCQREISDHADAGEPLSSESRAHLEGCGGCLQFADHWLAGPPGVLTQPVLAAADPALRERILHAASRPNVVRFPTPATGRTLPTPWLGRIAACLALAGFSYWLLNPTVSPVANPIARTGPTLTGGLRQLEDGPRREQRALQTALVASGRQVSQDVAWSMSALEL